MNIDKKTYYVLIGLLVLIPSAVFAADNYAQITMIPGQATNPIDIRASNGTSYFKVTPSGQVSIGTNHKICLDATCTTFFQSNGTSISGGSSSFTWGQISKVGSKLNDIGSPTSSYDMNSQPLNNVKFGNQVSLNGQTFNNNGHVSTFPSNTGTLVQQNGTFSGTLSSPTYSGNATFTKAGFPNTEIDAGSGNSPVSYIFGKFGSTFYAKNGTTGKIDYSGTDATSVMSSILNNGIPSTGGKIVIKAGTYPIHIVVPKSRIQFVGESWRNTILTQDSSHNRIFDITSPNYSNTINRTEISNMQIKGLITNAPNDCIFANSTEFLIIDHIDVNFCTRNGIYLEQTWWSQISNSYFHNTVGNETLGYSPIYINSGSSDSTNQLLIQRNLFERDSSTAIRSVGTTQPNYMISVINNDFEEHTVNRISPLISDIQPNSLINFTNTRFNLIQGNYFTGGNKSQIYLDTNSFGSKIIGNHLVPDLADCCVSNYGINTNATYTAITDNSISSSNTGAININTGATNAVIIGNRLLPQSGSYITGTLSNILECTGQCVGGSPTTYIGHILSFHNNAGGTDPSITSSDAGGRTLTINGALNINSTSASNYMRVNGNQKIATTNTLNEYILSPSDTSKQMGIYINGGLKMNFTNSKTNSLQDFNLTNNNLFGAKIITVQNSLGTSNPTISSADAGGRTLKVNGNIVVFANSSSNYIAVNAGQQLLTDINTGADYFKTPSGVNKQIGTYINNIIMQNVTSNGVFDRMYNSTGDLSASLIPKNFCVDVLITGNLTLHKDCNVGGVLQVHHYS